MLELQRGHRSEISPLHPTRDQIGEMGWDVKTHHGLLRIRLCPRFQSPDRSRTACARRRARKQSGSTNGENSGGSPACIHPCLGRRGSPPRIRRDVSKRRALSGHRKRYPVRRSRGAHPCRSLRSVNLFMLANEFETKTTELLKQNRSKHFRKAPVCRRTSQIWRLSSHPRASVHYEQQLRHC